MGWRKLMSVDSKNELFETPIQNVQNIQNPKNKDGKDNSVGFVGIVDGNRKVKNPETSNNPSKKKTDWSVYLPLWNLEIGVTVENGEVVLSPKKELTEIELQEAEEYAREHRDEILKLHAEAQAITPRDVGITICGDCEQATFRDHKFWCLVANRAAVDFDKCPKGKWSRPEQTVTESDPKPGDQSDKRKCFSCGGVSFWRKNKPNSKWICSACHPPAPGLDIVLSDDGCFLSEK